MELCIEDNGFIFNGEVYKQFEGFAMGSPLSAPMANIFLCHHEKKWLDECPLAFKPIFYKRYVDDTFLVFKESQHVPLFLNYLNAKHPNIKFTMEKEENNKLNFLDMTVEKTQSNHHTNFDISVFRKRTFTGLGMNFHSFTFFNYKLNNIKTLIHRAINICSTWVSFHNEVSFLLKYFKNNGYPEHLVFRVLNRFLSSHFNPRIPVSLAKKKEVYCKLPFLSNIICSFLKRELFTILSSSFPHIDFKFIFVNNFTIHGLLNHKEKLPDGMRSGIVYLYQCGVCNAIYVGKTLKCLRSRAAEHRGFSSRTGDPLARPPQSAIREHAEVCGSDVILENFKCIKSVSNPLILKLSESLEILYKKPILNIDNSSYPINLTM